MCYNIFCTYLFLLLHRKGIDNMSDNNRRRLLILIASILVAFLLIICMPDKTKQKSQELSYDEVVVAINNNDIERITAKQGSLMISIQKKNDESQYWAVVENLEEFCIFVSDKKEQAKTDLKLDIQKGTSSNIASLISSLCTLGFTVVILVYFSKMINGGNQKFEAVKTSVSFSDVAGIDEEKKQVMEIVEFLKNPDKFEKMGARVPKGILLSGEPGTGKTLLAKAIAGEADVPFFQANGSNFEEKFVGVGASRVRKLFDEAKKVAPAIIFIDEIDSVAKDRYSRNSYSEQTLNQLLSEMDGFEERDNIIVIAATNHAEVLDSAITRPGRFDRIVYIPKPNLKAREEILEVHASNKIIEEDVSLLEIARKTVGFSGAELENVLNEAAIIAVNQNNHSIGNEELDEAIAKVMIGLKKENSGMSEEERLISAIHESGHAIVSAVVRPEVKNLGISIVPRGQAGGYNFFDEPQVFYKKKSDLEKKIQVFYGGRVAEELIFGEASTGASNDIEMASKIAYDMVVKYGMDHSLLSKIRQEDDFNSQMDSVSIEKAELICQQMYKRTTEILTCYKDQIIKLANLLMQNEYLSQDEVNSFVCDNIKD